MLKLDDINFDGDAIKGIFKLSQDELVHLKNDVYLEYAVSARKCIDQVLLDLKIKGCAEIICQRCLNDVQVPVMLENTVALVEPNNPDVEAIMVDYECVELQQGEVSIEQIVRDEFLLGLPDLHSNRDECSDTLFSHTDSHIDAKTRKPFSNLAKLMK